MPELPEVETTRRGIAPYLIGRRVTGVILRRPDLRWPIPREVSELLPGQRIDAVERRAKYLLLHTEAGSALLHLGMSGVLRVLPPDAPVGRHDHVDIALEPTSAQASRILRFTDPRRFGCLLWQAPGTTHELLAKLGPEPLTDAFDGDLLWHTSRGRTAAVKLFLMDNAIVVGVGNIYASEALFRARVDPRRPARSLSPAEVKRLAQAILAALSDAIERDQAPEPRYVEEPGAPNPFQVYGQAGQRCPRCRKGIIERVVLGQRSTFFCPACQR